MKLNSGTLLSAPLTAVSLIEAFGDVRDFPRWFDAVLAVHRGVQNILFSPFAMLGLTFSEWQRDAIFLTSVAYICILMSSLSASGSIAKLQKFREQSDLDDYIDLNSADRGKTRTAAPRERHRIASILLGFGPPVLLPLVPLVVAFFSVLTAPGVSVDTGQLHIGRELIKAVIVQCNMILMLYTTLILVWWPLRTKKDVLSSARALRLSRQYWVARKVAGEITADEAASAISHIAEAMDEHRAKYKEAQELPSVLLGRLWFVVAFTVVLYASLAILAN